MPPRCLDPERHRDREPEHDHDAHTLFTPRASHARVGSGTGAISADTRFRRGGSWAIARIGTSRYAMMRPRLTLADAPAAGACGRGAPAALPAHSSMIRRLLARLIPGKSPVKPRIYGSDAHPVRRSALSRGALEVTRKLHDVGFKAFIVGGAVRDLLLGIVPKDFDIATNATPEEIKPLFRRAFIIGRRFRLVHVLAGAETVEVSTFRGTQAGDDFAE